MSATPPNAAPGRTPPGGPNGPFFKMRRPRPSADPLVRPKKRPIPRPSAKPGVPGAPPATNGQARPPSLQPQKPQKEAPISKPKPTPSADDMTVNGFSGPLLSQTYVDYPLVTTKRAWRESLKNHVAKFISKKNIDLQDESQFTRPVRLQRRDPRAQTGTATGDEENGQKGPKDTQAAINEAEREQAEAKKAARAKEREENLAQIAPSAAANAKRSNAPKQRIQQVFKAGMTPSEIAKARTKYEEALPWHLEDFDNKNTWVGKYEAAMSETYAMFVLESTGRMRMLPIDKWYKFSAKSSFKALTIEEAEKHMAKKIKDPRWFMEKEHDRMQKKELEQYAKQRKIYTGRVQSSGIGDGLEGDEMDFEEDRFADDEEHAVVEEDEDAKDAEKRIKKDQLKANVFDLKDETVYDAEENQERKEKEALKSFGKQVRKALQRREKNFDYSSGSDANPYSDDESTDESEVERLKEEQRKLEEEKKRKEKEGEKSSGTNSKGNTTPSDRQKHIDALKKAPPGAKKRPGSPNLSEASGTDTPRKKAKNKHVPPQPASKPGSRPMSPTPSTASNATAGKANKKKRVRNATGGAGSGSDIERAGSGAEMSDSTVSKRLKINPPGVRSKTGTPGGSRAGSPDAPGRAGSAGLLGQLPTPEQVHAAIPATGIQINDLLRVFRPRLGDSKENHRKFITIVKEISIYNKEDKLLRPAQLKDKSPL